MREHAIQAYARQIEARGAGRQIGTGYTAYYAILHSVIAFCRFSAFSLSAFIIILYFIQILLSSCHDSLFFRHIVAFRFSSELSSFRRPFIIYVFHSPTISSHFLPSVRFIYSSSFHYSFFAIFLHILLPFFHILCCPHFRFLPCLFRLSLFFENILLFINIVIFILLFVYLLPSGWYLHIFIILLIIIIFSSFVFIIRPRLIIFFTCLHIVHYAIFIITLFVCCHFFIIHYLFFAIHSHLLFTFSSPCHLRHYHLRHTFLYYYFFISLAFSSFRLNTPLFSFFLSIGFHYLFFHIPFLSFDIGFAPIVIHYYHYYSPTYYYSLFVWLSSVFFNIRYSFIHIAFFILSSFRCLSSIICFSITFIIHFIIFIIHIFAIDIICFSFISYFLHFPPLSSLSSSPPSFMLIIFHITYYLHYSRPLSHSFLFILFILHSTLRPDIRFLRCYYYWYFHY